MINQIEPMTRVHILLLFFILFFTRSEAQEIIFDTAKIAPGVKEKCSRCGAYGEY